ncbi:hypothetical protein BU16DRAFT_619956 [Lophium mytilinum]|uniref:Uncharacterized protein n=1 Tax=Lophium mytilinum TaxID=390894 RepID=A0A6A6QLG0_9PEZI|nr:hypothetical protein BU16DRAFT_619956 [Lophium mytilinum]
MRPSALKNLVACAPLAFIPMSMALGFAHYRGPACSGDKLGDEAFGPAQGCHVRDDSKGMGVIVSSTGPTDVNQLAVFFKNDSCNEAEVVETIDSDCSNIQEWSSYYVLDVCEGKSADCVME